MFGRIPIPTAFIDPDAKEPVDFEILTVSGNDKDPADEINLKDELDRAFEEADERWIKNTE